MGCAERLLEDVVDAGEALYGLVEHEEGDDEAGELAGCHLARFDFYSRVGEEADDGEGSEELDQRRGQGLLGGVAEVCGTETPGGLVEAAGFAFLGDE